MFNHIDRTGTYDNKSNLPRQKFNNNELISLGCADSEIAIAEPIQQAITHRVAHPIFGYTQHYEDFYTSIQQYYERHHSVKIEKDQMFFTPGVVSAIAISLKELLKDGGAVCMLHPEYPPFENVCKAAGYAMEFIHMHEDANLKYSIDFNQVEEKLSKSKVFLYSNPHNPTGNVLSEDLSKIIKICEQYNVTILSDEIWADFCYVPFTSILKQATKNVVCFYSVSKSFNIAGMQMAFTVCQDPPLLTRLKSASEQLHVSPSNPIALAAIQAATTSCDDWLLKFKDFIRENQLFVINYLQNNMPLIRTRLPESTFLLFLDFSALFKTAEEALAFCVKQGVFLQPGTDFCARCNCKLRMNVTSGRDVIENALKKIKIGYDQLRKERSKDQKVDKE
ncbi:Selenocystathionine_beta-lyase / Cystathionine beta-lyase [Hexamita inflata]|uniref:cysteine-S-conjugate beta-lyase n=1 Tax=Hexamita inflata TaxID=28002 RepID=A0AA86RQI3_9EUKA|nr:Selenocystathionine beta-lyase / Cystathionine beta-lyase [Hexamita inflata]